MKNIKKQLQSESGLTLFELLIVLAVMGILSAMSFSIYKAFINNSEISGTVSGVQNIQTIAGYYGQENGGFGGLNGQILQADNLIPSGWTYGGTGNNELIPQATSFVSYYWIGPVTGNALGFTAGNYIIGVDAPSITDAQAQVLCEDFAGQAQQYAYGGTMHALPCSIPVNSNLFNNVLYFSF